MIAVYILRAIMYALGLSLLLTTSLQGCISPIGRIVKYGI
jgi:hypothetical protein